MANLFKMEGGQLFALVGKFDKAGLTAELGEAILKDPSLAAVGVEAIRAMIGVVPVDDHFAARFKAAIAACNFDWVSDDVTPRNFPESVFGEVGEGHVLDQPPATEKGYWTESEVDSWLAEKAKEGLEAATIADGLDFVSKNPEAHRDGPVVFWASVSVVGLVAFLYWYGHARELRAFGRGVDWGGDCRFLLRKVRKD